MSSSLKEQAKKSFELNGKNYTFYSLNTLDELGLTNVDNLPYY